MKSQGTRSHCSTHTLQYLCNLAFMFIHAVKAGHVYHYRCAGRFREEGYNMKEKFFRDIIFSLDCSTIL